MKIWCCLCFTEDEEDDDKKRMTLIDDESDGSIAGNEEVQMQFGLALDMFDEPFPDLIAALPESDDMGPHVRRAPRWRPLIRQPRRYEGECSSSGVGDGDGGSDLAIDDLQHKRAKVFSTSPRDYGTEMLSDPGGSSSLQDKNCNIRMGSLVSPANEILYHNYIWNNTSDESPIDPTGGKGDGKENDTLKTEDIEVRMDLTDDLLHLVFSFLDYADLCRAAIVCRQWRAASAHEDFWRCLNFENRKISIEQFEDLCRRYPNATEVNLYGVPAMHLLVMNMVFLRNLESLTLGRYEVGDGFFHALADCSMLKRLDVHDATLGNGAQEILINHDQLCHLELIKCRMMRVSVRCPQLVHLSLKRSNMAQAVLNCPLLSLLDIAACHKLSDAAIRLAVTSCPQLENLDMSNCSCVSDETLREIALSCANLHFLNSSYCPNISLESVRLPMLTVLKLHSCEGITSASMAAISHCYMLEVLELDNCNLLASVSLDLSRLQIIRLVHCRKFVELNLRTIMLSSINVSNCAALTSLELRCPNLEKVCLDGCDHLERASFCPVALQSLNLGICPKLKSLTIEASSMAVLELKGCGVLSEASINCPLLTSLDASFCSQLKDDCLSATTTSCPLIKSLILMSCSSIGSDGLYSLQPLSNLTMLDLSYTFLTNLQPVFESCSQLKVLKLQACKCLTDTSLEPLYKKASLPALEELDLSYGTLGQSAIEELLAYCTRLTHVSLNGCVNMHDLNWDSSGCHPLESTEHGLYGIFSHENVHESTEHPDRLLQNLNCVGCPNIRKVLIPPQARCFHLSSLNLSLSANLKEVDVACITLCFLNLSNCCSLEALRLACPKLTSLFLQSCNIKEEVVEYAISQCSILETLDVRSCPKICSMGLGKLRAARPSLKHIFSSLTPA